MIAWNKCFIGRYYSTWSVIQILEWMNCISVKPIGYGRGWRLPLGGRYVELPIQSSDVQGLGACREALLEVSALLFARERRVSGALRLCPVCVRTGAHFAYQQETRYAKCLLHRVALVSGCPHCGRYLSADGANCHGFRCGHCKRGFLRGGQLRAIVAANDVKNVCANEDAVGWQALVSRMVEPVQDTGNIAWPKAGNSAGDCDPAVWDHWVLSCNPGHPVGRVLGPKPVGLIIQPCGMLQPALGADDGPQVAGRTVLEYGRLLRCVSRHVKATYLKNHKPCLARSQRLIFPLRNDFEPCLMLRPGLCPLAQAYVVWLRQRKAELKRINLVLQEQCTAGNSASLEGEVLPLRLPSPRAAAASWISSYEAIVSAICLDGRMIMRLPSYMPIVSLSITTWPLAQVGASMECPIHLRDPRIQELAVCDRGKIMRKAIQQRRESAAVRLQALINALQRFVPGC